MQKVILIADDNENDALAISQTLGAAGVKNPLISVSDGVEVIAYFAGQGKYWDRKKFPIPAVLLLDLKMPRIGGFAVMDWLKGRKEVLTNTLVVVLTGHGDLENVKRAYSLGARSFLTKPCLLEDIRNLVRAYSACFEIEMQSVAAMTNNLASGHQVPGAASGFVQ